MYTRKDLAVLWYSFGLLTGLLVAFASCSAEPELPPNPSTTVVNR
jgi:hypothetical protein